MKKALLLLATLLVGLTATAIEQDSGGNYLIGSAQDLTDFAALVNGGNNAINGLVTADIELSGTWQGIGTEDNNYNGTFDGARHKIGGFESSYGLFNYIGATGTVKRVIVNANVHSNDNCGAIAASNNGLISQCGNIGAVRGGTGTNSSGVGGICGTNGGMIEFCYNQGTVSGRYVGGIVGYNLSKGTVRYCYNSGSLTMDYIKYSSAIIGNYYGTGSNCYTLEGSAQHHGSEGYAGTVMTAEQFASGEVCYLLQKDFPDEQMWGQLLGTDNVPMLTDDASKHVYKVSETEYANHEKENGLTRDEAGNYLIGSAEDWRAFADLVNIGNTTINAKMTADVDLGTDQTMIGAGVNDNNSGSGNVVYNGTFDGAGHTLTIHYVTDELFAAPFRHIQGATIKNLHVDGTITTSNRYAAGIVGGVYGQYIDTYITTCWSSVKIVSSYENTGDFYSGSWHGGIASHLYFYGQLHITDCLFTGEITGETKNVVWGGMMGMPDGTVTFTNCLQVGTLTATGVITGSNGAGTFSSTFGSGYASKVNVSNSYYLTAFGNKQGTQASAADLAGGAIVDKLQAGRTEAIWVQDTDYPMLRLFKQGEQAVTAYAMLSDDGTTLTFKMDANMPATNAWYVRNTGTYRPGWNGSVENVTKAVFEPSFADARPVSCSYWFADCKLMTEIEGLEYLNTGEVTTMCAMFNACTSLTTVDVSHFDTSNVTDMSGMFGACTKLTSVDVTNFDTSKVTNMSTMFSSTSALKTLDVNSFVVSWNCKTDYMFQASGLETIWCNNSWLNGSSSNMFQWCYALVGAQSYNQYNLNSYYANPSFGYFTWKKTTLAQTLQMPEGRVYCLSDDVEVVAKAGNTYYVKSLESDSWVKFEEYEENEERFAVGDIVSRVVGTLTGLDTAPALVTGSTYRYNAYKTGTVETPTVLREINLANAYTRPQLSEVVKFTGYYYDGKLCGKNGATDKGQTLTLDTEYLTDVTFIEGDTYTVMVGVELNEAGELIGKALAVTNHEVATSDEISAYAILSDDGTTLTFKMGPTPVRDAWDVANTGTKVPGWYNSRGAVTTVVFDESFATARPKSCYQWFNNFYNLTSVEGIGNLNTDEVTDMSYMFAYSQLTSLDVSNFNTANVTKFDRMFSWTKLTSIDVNNFVVSEQATTELMFFGCEQMTAIYCDNTWTPKGSDNMFLTCRKLVGAIKYDSNKVDGTYANPETGYFTYKTPATAYAELSGTTLTFKNDRKMPSTNAWKLTDTNSIGIPDWNEKCEKITTVVFDAAFADARPMSCDYWFLNMKNLTSIEGLEYLNTSEVTTMNSMFANCESLTEVNVDDFDVTGVTNTRYMFQGCKNLTTIWCDNTWTIAGESGNMFYGCESLVGAISYDSGKLNGDYANPVTGYFTYATPPTPYAMISDDGTTLTFKADHSMPATNAWDVSDTSDWFNMKWYSYRGTITTVVFDESFAAARPKSCASWFYYFGYLTTIEGINNLNTGEVTDMSYMFSNCRSLTNLDLSSFNTANVTNMRYMFYYCEELTELNLSGFNTANVTNMGNMFAECKVLTTLDLTDFNTANVTNMAYMFNHCDRLAALDLSSFNTANVTDMRCMFQSCYYLTALNVSNFNTDNVSSMFSMFYHCDRLAALDLSSFNTANVTTMEQMFYNCEKLTTLDLTNFNTDKVTTMEDMFAYCYGLKTIYCNDTWTPVYSPRMFLDCNNLVGAIKYNDSKKTSDYANPETGYFTYKREPLASVLQQRDGTSRFVDEDLVVAAVVGNHCYAKSMESDSWVRLDLNDDVTVAPGNTLSDVKGTLADHETAPALTVKSCNVEATAVPVTLQEVDLRWGFEMPQLSEAVKFTGFYYDGQLRGWNGTAKGQSLTLDTTYAGDVEFIEADNYTVLVGIAVKEPWQAAEDDNAPAGAPLRARSSYDYDFQNLIGEVVAVQNHQIMTGIEDIELANPARGQRYNILGQPVDENYRGIVIQDGRKFIVK